MTIEQSNDSQSRTLPRRASVPSLNVILRNYFHPTMWEDLLAHIVAAETLCLGLRLENMGEEGIAAIELTVYDDVLRVAEDQIDTWWPMPKDWQTVDRHRPSDDGDELFRALTDPRWATHQCRAFKLAVGDAAGATSSYAWRVDFSDHLLDPDCDYNSFIHDGDLG